MISIGTSGKWEGIDTLAAEELAALRAPATEGVRRATQHLANEVKKTLSGPRHGRIYKISRSGRLHVASAPGEPPAVLYGRLRQSIRATEPVWVDNNVTAEVVAGTPYARRLEFGGVDSRGIRIEARPYFEPTIQREQATVNALLESPF